MGLDKNALEVGRETPEMGPLSGDFNETGLLYIVQPDDALSTHAEPLAWQHYRAEIAALIQRQLSTNGAILFRGFEFAAEAGFYDFVQTLGGDLLSYDYGSTPRTHLGKRVYTSTEYPAHQRIPLHNEQAYTLQWPLKLWFQCVVPATEGGATPIADSRRIFQRLDPAIRKRFETKQLLYVRNYGNGLDVPWQQAFNTDNVAQVNAYAQQQCIELDWKPDGGLRTRQRCQATAQHPSTGEWVWFNQAHLFHVSALAPDVRSLLLDVVSEADLPRNVYYGDGTPIEESILDEIRAVIDGEQVIFHWQRQDVLLLDNMLTAHGRTAFKGERKVIVAMTEPNHQESADC